LSVVRRPLRICVYIFTPRRSILNSNRLVQLTTDHGQLTLTVSSEKDDSALLLPLTIEQDPDPPLPQYSGVAIAGCRPCL
jgi:hypothetical protein